MDSYIIVYVGYEGIEKIYSHEVMKEIAIRKVKEKRETIEEMNKKYPRDTENETLGGLSPQEFSLWLKEPKRVCVMGIKDGEYECCCRELGVSIDDTIFY